MICSECGSEIKENAKVCEECGYERASKRRDNTQFLLDFKVERYLKWGGIVIVLLGLLFVPRFMISVNMGMGNNRLIEIYNTFNSAITTIMRGLYYYGIGMIIILLKKIYNKVA